MLFKIVTANKTDASARFPSGLRGQLLAWLLHGTGADEPLPLTDPAAVPLGGARVSSEGHTSQQVLVVSKTLWSLNRQSARPRPAFVGYRDPLLHLPCEGG